MLSSVTATKPEASPSDAIYYRVGDLMLKLLDGFERDIADSKLPSPHLEAYEALCRAHATWRG
jgi:hypothetical protein